MTSPRLVAHPAQEWTPRVGNPPSFEDWTTVEMDSCSVAERYKLLVAAVVPRPIAFVSTVDGQGNGNLAPFSFFAGVSSNPPIVMISITPRPEGGRKDTALNIVATKQFVVNASSERIAGAVHFCSAPFPSGANEGEAAGLTPLPSHRISPPRVAESPLHMECELEQIVSFGDGAPGSAEVFFGRIVLMHIASAAMRDGRPTVAGLEPLARLGGQSYSCVQEYFDIARPNAPEKSGVA